MHRLVFFRVVNLYGTEGRARPIMTAAHCTSTWDILQKPGYTLTLH